ncbi:MAG: methyltransferase domain-containing protein [Anaerolineaceae bacterium]|nr:methyltransferase domain-containing protein [Anaerolineaceae bacterium]
MFEDIPRRHAQFQAQALWTKSIRAYLFNQCGLSPEQQYLEVGCGTGVILKEWEHVSSTVTGIDIDFPSLRYASTHADCPLSAANVLELPFTKSSFDCIFSHFFFLWVKNPLQALEEIKRCLKPGGWILIFAEPDYDGRIDYPEELSIIRQLQIKSLQNIGADPIIGRKMGSYLNQTGFTNISGGIIGSEWHEPQSIDEIQSVDIQNIIYDISIGVDGIDPNNLLQVDQQARHDGSRITFVPTFFYSAQK